MLPLKSFDRRNGLIPYPEERGVGCRVRSGFTWFVSRTDLRMCGVCPTEASDTAVDRARLCPQQRPVPQALCAGRAAVTCASSQLHREGGTDGLCDADSSEGIPKVDKTRKPFQAEGITCGKALGQHAENSVCVVFMHPHSYPMRALSVPLGT